MSKVHVGDVVTPVRRIKHVYVEPQVIKPGDLFTVKAINDDGVEIAWYGYEFGSTRYVDASDLRKLEDGKTWTT